MNYYGMQLLRVTDEIKSHKVTADAHSKQRISFHLLQAVEIEYD